MADHMPSDRSSECPPGNSPESELFDDADPDSQSWSLDGRAVYMGRRFTISINSSFDVEFEFDADLGQVSDEDSDLRVGLALLVYIVWRIAWKIGTDRVRSAASLWTERKQEVPNADPSRPGGENDDTFL